MPKFEYVITDSIGKKREGSISASDEKSATEKLRKEDEIIISVTEKKKGRWFIFGKPSMGTQEKINFAKSLSTMIKVGLTVTESFEILKSQAKKRSHRMMYEDILERIRAGQSLSQTFRNYNYLFSDLFINMLETGEQSGNLSSVLNRLTIQLEKDNDIRKRVVSAFIYPGIIISITLLMAVGIVVFIMPKITKIFKGFNIDLPLPTRILIGISEFVTGQPLVAGASLLGVISLFVILPKLKFLKPFWHTVFLKLPIFGELLIFANVARFARTLNSLMKSGVPIAKSLRMTGNMLDNVLYQNALALASEKVEQGGNMGESLEDNPKLFPPLATKMLYIGEKTGSLEITTRHIAKLYEKNVEDTTKNLSVMLEPILLVFMALIVGGIALSIILPIYQLPNLLSK